MVRVKICGITNLEDALNAVNFGADAVGFVFYKKSPRYIRPDKANDIIRQLPKGIKKTGVFVNPQEKTIRHILKKVNLDILQLHGNESVEFCRRFDGIKIIKVFRMPVLSKGSFCKDDSRYKTESQGITGYDVWAYLFDAFEKGKYGGTGRIFDWRVLNCFRLRGKIIFLSGGLNQGNVRAALKSFPADWVDASSSLEQYPGKKDTIKVKNFIRIVKTMEE